MFVVCTCFRVLFRVFLQAGKTTYLTESLVFFEENRKPDFWASKSSQDFAADLASLRDDVAKLNSSLSEFIRTHSATNSNTVFDAADNAPQRISGTANKAYDHGTTTDVKTTIEHKPMVAALIAMVAGMLVGLLSRGRK